MPIVRSQDNRANTVTEREAPAQTVNSEEDTRLQATQDVVEAADPFASDATPLSPLPSIAVRQPTLDITKSATEGKPDLSLKATRSNPPNATIHETTPTGSLTPNRAHSRRNSGESSESKLSRTDSGATDSGASKTTHPLREQLEDARLECPLRPHSFLVPKDIQEKLITVSTIANDILAHKANFSKQEAEKHAERACKVARHLYATLAYIKRSADICALLEEGITDNDLPLIRKPNDPHKTLYLGNDGDIVKSMETWRSKYRENFDRVQWWMTAPVFKEWRHYTLDEKTVLPFIPLDPEDEKLGKKQGGYSEVYPVRIHSAHHKFWKCSEEETQPLVAVKQLFSSEEKEFQKESTILIALGPKKHPHLIRLLATYEMGRKYHLMFPYANANLRTYWEDHAKPNFDAETVLWSLKQMCGIASGLQLIHDFKVTIPLSVPGAGDGEIRLPKGKGLVQLKVAQDEQWYGRHGDIKPENVLWFEKDQTSTQPHPMGVLQIADFGLGRFHGRDSRSRVNPETILSSPTYEPPECKLRLPVSRAYDIWSLGCIYLEFITWLMRGSAAIDGFADLRGHYATDTEIDDDNFFTIHTDDGVLKAQLREGVLEWREKLHADENCSQLIHDLLNLTMSQLLVIDTDKRIKASRLCMELKLLLRKAETHPDYLLKPVPRKPATGRSNSAPVPDSQRTNGKRGSITFLEPPKTHFNVRVDEDPKDLVLRTSGTPNYKHPTWPMNQRQQTAHG